MKIEDPAIDLAMVFALLSSYEDIPLSQKICFAGEIGLSGEIRAVNRVDQRVSEAEKLGFKKIICPRNKLESKFKIEVIEVKTLSEAIVNI